MSEQPPNSLEEVRIHGEIGDDPKELAAVADAVVRGCSICYARITSLRALIEAVQQHPDAKLTPPNEERGDDWEPPSDEREHYSTTGSDGSPDALTHLRIYAGEILDADCQSLDIRVTFGLKTRFATDATFHETRFDGAASFNDTRFDGGASFSRTHFSGVATFYETHFARDAWFDQTHFAGETGFYGMHFAGDAWFRVSHFAGDAWFGETHFTGDAWFGETHFAGYTSFYETHFAGDAWFDGAHFAGPAQFDETHFAGEARFDGTRFAGEVSGDLRPWYLRTSDFGEQARRDVRRCQRARERYRRQKDATASKMPKTWRARLVAIGDWSADLGKKLEKSRWAKWLVRVPKALLVTAPSRIWRWITRDFGWGTVRALGQLQILNRVSVVALIAVPVLAALTGALQEQFPKWPGLGTSPALLFFAAVFVTLGLLAYQVWSAEDVRKYDEDEFIDRAHRRYPEEATDRDDGLRRSIEHLEAIAERRPDRHANFVAHHGDTIWIPPRDEIGWFEDWTPPPDPPDPQDNEADDDRAGAGRDIASRETVESSEDRSGPDKAQQRGMVPGAERRRITIEEGAKAEYWLKSREGWPLAWVSFTLYLVGIVCLLDVLRRQAINVAETAGWTSWPFG